MMTSVQDDIDLRCAACGRSMDVIEWRLAGPVLRVEPSDAILRSIAADQHDLTYRCRCLMSFHVDVAAVITVARLAHQQGRHAVWVTATCGLFTIDDHTPDQQ